MAKCLVCPVVPLKAEPHGYCTKCARTFAPTLEYRLIQRDRGMARRRRLTVEQFRALPEYSLLTELK